MNTVIDDGLNLGKAIKNSQDEIEITAYLQGRITRINITGRAAWAIAAVSAVIAVASIISEVSSVGISPVITVTAGLIGSGTAFGILGSAATATAIGIGVSGRGAGTLKSLRDNYSVQQLPNGNCLLKKVK